MWIEKYKIIDASIYPLATPKCQLVQVVSQKVKMIMVGVLKQDIFVFK